MISLSISYFIYQHVKERKGKYIKKVTSFSLR